MGALSLFSSVAARHAISGRCRWARFGMSSSVGPGPASRAVGRLGHLLWLLGRRHAATHTPPFAPRPRFLVSMAPSRRLTGPLAALAALLTVVTACGSSRPATEPPGTTGPPGTTAPPSAGAGLTTPSTPGDPGQTSGAAPTPAADRALASAVNLTPADLPGWTSEPNRTTASDRDMQARLAECAGAPDQPAVEVVDVGSPTFHSGSGDVTSEVTSDVTTVRSLADGRSDLRAMQSDKLPACIQQVAVPYLRSQLPAGATISDVTVRRLGAPAGVPDSFSYRLVVPVSDPGGGKVTITSDSTGFLVGRAEVELNDTETGSVPDPALEHRLVALLYQRARQAAA